MAHNDHNHHNHNHNHDDHINNPSTKSGLLEHHHSVWSEILCHLPYAIFSVSLCMIFLSFIPNLEIGYKKTSIAYRLFHNFHFLHLLFAGTGTVLTFRKYSKNIPLCILTSLLVPIIFCTFSDAFLPYLGGKFVSLDMHFHWCFLKHIGTVAPFLLAGVLNGWVMSNHATSVQLFYSIGFHFSHILISSMASMLYLISFGFHNWWDRMGFVFMFLIGAVLIPCTLSDIVVPMLFAALRPHGRKK